MDHLNSQAIIHINHYWRHHIGAKRFSTLSADQRGAKHVGPKGRLPLSGQTQSLRFLGCQLQSKVRSHSQYGKQNEAEVPHGHTLQEHYRITFRYVEKKKLSLVFEPGQS